MNATDSEPSSGLAQHEARRIADRLYRVQDLTVTQPSAIFQSWPLRESPEHGCVDCAQKKKSNDRCRRQPCCGSGAWLRAKFLTLEFCRRSRLTPRSVRGTAHRKASGKGWKLRQNSSGGTSWSARQPRREPHSIALVSRSAGWTPQSPRKPTRPQTCSKKLVSYRRTRAIVGSATQRT